MRHPERAPIIGLDLSLRGSAACSIPARWNHTLDRVHVFQVGQPLPRDATDEQQIERLHMLSTALVDWAMQEVTGKPGPTHLAIEAYAFSQSGAHARSIAELTGLVKWRLYQFGFEVQSIPASRARKILLGKLPRKDVKKVIARRVRAIPGAEKWTEDQCDAFCCCNAAVMHTGGVALTLA